MEDYRNTSLSPEARARDLLARMSVEEKIFQLSAQMLVNHDKEYGTARDYRLGHYRNPGHFMHQNKAVTRRHSEIARAINADVEKSMAANRFGIPVLENGEALHGAQWGMATCFPQPIALAATFDIDTMNETADAIGKEVHAAGVRQVFAPVVNITRDCRWGRTMETYGEDVLISSDFGSAMCRGLQKNGVIATPKHFVDNYADGGRDSNESLTSWRVLREVYLQPFKRCFTEGGAMSTMAAYNGTDGVPCSCNKKLLTDILRGEWGFEGFVVSDYGGVDEVCYAHKVAGDMDEAQAKCLKAGLEVNLPSPCHEFIKGALAKGELTEEDIDRAAFRVLTAKFKIGLMDEPFVDPDRADEIVRCEAHRAIALKGGRECPVLLKNEGVLPLNKGEIRRLGVFGAGKDVWPIGENYSGPYGGWRGDAETPLSYLKKYLGEDTEIVTGSDAEIPVLAPKCDACLYFTSVVEGEGMDRCNIRLTREHTTPTAKAEGGIIVDAVKDRLLNDQDAAIAAMAAANRRSVAVLMNGAPLDITPWAEGIGAVLEAWYPGEMGGQAITELLFGEISPSGKLPITFPRSVGQLPLYYAHKTSGRGYGYNENDGSPLYPFGYGLSYTAFAFGNYETRVEGEKVSVSFDITNTGAMDGAEVAQVYLAPKRGLVLRPVLMLEGYKRVQLKKGETKRVTVQLDREALYYYDEDMNFGLHDGEYALKLGTSSTDFVYEAALSVKSGKVTLK